MKIEFIDLEKEYEDDGSIYSQASRDFLIDEDEISSEEDGFMQGWETAFD